MGADAILFYFWHNAVIFVLAGFNIEKITMPGCEMKPVFPARSGAALVHWRIRKINPYCFEVFTGIDIKSQSRIPDQ